MSNSAQFPLAVHTMLLLASDSEHRITSGMIAKLANCHPVIIRNCFAKLRAAGLIVTRSGRGRNELTRPASEIPLWDIFAAVRDMHDNPLYKPHSIPDSCPPAACAQQLLGEYCDDAVAAARRSLSAITLQHMIDELKRRLAEDEKPGCAK